ncbi:MAG: 50S ribosomal protein L3 [Nitrospira sp.]|nr:50S ribosomal protein L3 [Nitrospira sp.]
MTQIFEDNGRVVPVSVVQAGPCKVVQLRTPEKNGYSAVQLAYQEVKESKVSKPAAGHFKKAAVPPARFLREFQSDLKDLQVGQVITADLFQKGEKIDVIGVSKGKGFAGVVKRHKIRCLAKPAEVCWSTWTSARASRPYFERTCRY